MYSCVEYLPKVAQSGENRLTTTKAVGDQDLSKRLVNRNFFFTQNKAPAELLCHRFYITLNKKECITILA